MLWKDDIGQENNTAIANFTCQITGSWFYVKGLSMLLYQMFSYSLIQYFFIQQINPKPPSLQFIFIL